MKKRTKQKTRLSPEEFKVARAALYDSYGGVKKKKFKPLAELPSYDADRGSSKYQSLISSAPAACGKRTMMSPEMLANETPEVQAEIIRKARRVQPLYNKGNAMYATDLELERK